MPTELDFSKKVPHPNVYIPLPVSSPVCNCFWCYNSMFIHHKIFNPKFQIFCFLFAFHKQESKEIPILLIPRGWRVERGQLFLFYYSWSKCLFGCMQLLNFALLWLKLWKICFHYFQAWGREHKNEFPKNNVADILAKHTFSNVTLLSLTKVRQK